MKRLKINWAIPGLLAMIIVIAAVAWIQTMSTTISTDPVKQAAQCSACHTMDTHVAAWKDSSHKDVACTACHADQGAMGFVHLKVNQVRMALNKDKVDLSQVKATVPNERCLDCHARQMPWVMQDLKPAKLDEKGEPIRPAKDQLEFLPAQAGHDLHLTMKNPLSCTECHSGASHGPAVQDKASRVEAFHKLCLDCHAEQKVTMTVKNGVSCSACHNDLSKVKPADHNSTAFRNTHGKSAEQDPTTCSQCHLNSITPANGTAPHTTASNAKPNPLVAQLPPNSVKLPEGGVKDSCDACHGTTMPHAANFLTTHAKGFLEQPQQCAACHGTKDQGFNMSFKGDPKTLSTTNPSCTGCHQQPMPHPSDYVQNGHAQAAQTAPKSCEQCHSPANKANPASPHAKALFCQDCHLNKFSHPSGFTITHKLVMNQVGNDPSAAGCTQCHSLTTGGTNSCTKCHTNGITAKEQWHPSDWTATHKATLAQYGNSQSAAGCTQCHTSDKNDKTGLSCTVCHTNGVTGSQQWHPADWVGTHSKELAKTGNNQSAAGCTQCHPANDTTNSTGLSCTACHKNGVNQPTQWHPNFWWVTHSRTTKPSDVQSCNQCHSYIEPSCTKCHSRGF